MALLPKGIYSQNKSLSQLDSLRYYESQIKKYNDEDTSLRNVYTRRLINFTARVNDKQLLFTAYLILADINLIKGSYDIAIKKCFHALEYAEYIEDKQKIARIYDNLIFIYRIRGERDRMFESLDKSISIKEAIGDIKGIYETKFNLTYYYRNTGDYYKAFKLAYEALNYYETQRDTSGILLCYYNVSRTYQSLGNYNKAIEVIGLSKRYIVGGKYEIERSRLNKGAGILQLRLGHYQDALNNFLKCLNIENKLGNKFRILYCYNNIGVAYSYLKNFRPAMDYFNICIREYIKTGRLKDLANVYNSVGLHYEQKNTPDSSIHYFLKSIEICEKTDYKDVYLNSAQAVSRVYRQMGKLDSAFIYLEKYHALSESVDRSNVASDVTAEEFENIRRKEQEIVEINKKNTFLRSVIIAGFLVLVILASWIIVVIQKSKIQKSQLEKQNLEHQKVDLKDQINVQNKELVSKILQLSDNDSGVKLTIKKLNKLKAEMGVNSKQKIQQVINDLEHSINSNIWDEFEHRFTKVHPQLYEKLSMHYPNLTNNERRLCALILLDLSSKEIANITKQSHNSILVAKSRLRGKLNKPEDVKIVDFLHELMLL